MSRTSLWIGCTAVVAIAASLACGSSSGSSTATSVSAQTVAQNKPIPNVCTRQIVTPADLVGVLPGAVTAKTIDGDPQTCEFKGDGYARVSITVRPGLGDVTVTQWTGGNAPLDSTAADGIGDRARWQSTLHELIATKGNVLCDIGAQGVDATEAELQKKFGQLCDKIWAAR